MVTNMKEFKNMTIKELAVSVAEAHDADKYWYPVIKKMKNHLYEKGYLTRTDGRAVVTDVGTALGMTYETRISQRGTTYNEIILGENIQEELTSLWDDFKNEVDVENGGEYFTSKEKKSTVQGVFNGENIKFKRFFANHLFTDSEVAQLLNGESIIFSSQSNNKTHTYCGHLQKLEGRSGHTYYRFVADFEEYYEL